MDTKTNYSKFKNLHSITNLNWLISLNRTSINLNNMDYVEIINSGITYLTKLKEIRDLTNNIQFTFESGNMKEYTSIVSKINIEEIELFHDMEKGLEGKLNLNEFISNSDNLINKLQGIISSKEVKKEEFAELKKDLTKIIEYKLGLEPIPFLI